MVIYQLSAIRAESYGDRTDVNCSPDSYERLYLRFEQSILKGFILTCLFAFAQGTFSPASSVNPQEKSTQLFEKAVELSDIHSEGSPSFLLKATVTLDEGGKSFEGKYVLSWIAQHAWREEISFPGYGRIRVGGIDKYWQQRTTSYELVRVFQVTQALDFVSALESGAKDASFKTKKEKHGGKEMICSVSSPKYLAEQEFCFDSVSSVLALERFPSGQSNGQSEVTAREYADFRQFGKKLFPRNIRVLEGSKAVVTITVDELNEISEAEPALYTPPKDAQVWESCRSSGHASMLSSVPPHYPESARARHVTGIVRAYGVVGENGFLQDLRVLNSPDSDLAAAGLEALRKWRYQPANCHGKPVREEILVDVTFVLGR